MTAPGSVTLPRELVERVVDLLQDHLVDVGHDLERAPHYAREACHAHYKDVNAVLCEVMAQAGIR